LTIEILRRYGESEEVANAAGAHHFDVEPASIEALIVAIADSLSAARPGARREMLENYVKRVQSLEQIADSFPGVEKAFAVQAGREVRLIVKPDQVDDLEAMRLAREIANKIEQEMEYPGQIKVTVIRETRAVEYAR
jgi:ribonuclease Y